MLYLGATEPWRNFFLLFYCLHLCQDLYCSKCRSVKSSKLQDYCRCSGRFVNAEGPEPFRQSMNVFLNIATHHDFHWLKDTVLFVLQR